MTLFAMAAAAEIGGGWLVWQALRAGRGWYYALAGALVLLMYGVIATFQPMDNFGRVYAVYGGFFILGSFLWGWAADGARPDMVDWVTTGVCMAAVLATFFWPR